MNMDDEIYETADYPIFIPRSLKNLTLVQEIQNLPPVINFQVTFFLGLITIIECKYVR